MVTNYPGHIMEDHTDAYIIGKLDSILTIATKQVHKSLESLVYSDHYSKKKENHAGNCHTLFSCFFPLSLIALNHQAIHVQLHYCPEYALSTLII